MVSGIALITFLATAIILIALVYAFTPAESGVAQRLEQLKRPANTSRAAETKFAEKHKERARDLLAKVGSLLPVSPGARATRAQIMMLRAGYRSAEATLAIQGMRILTPIALIIVVLAAGLYRNNPFFVFLFVIILGYMLPELWLFWKIKKRQRKLRLALPDGLDLLVVCVEVGLGLDQALLRVAQELRIVHRELSEELQMVNLEMRVGKTRIDALRELARRTGLDELKSLVAMLIQTERFGTSIAQSLRIFSDEMRTRRRQQAEEMSAKTTVKMVPPLVFFIFPALLVVILGPAVIALMHQFMK
ncbi:MAG TPA: type II secretion system F family protein [Candidatus Acidoferrales bacterium]|jgi:tight adherence protein C|nr:type II secretion system F family protein [Candidatus Acidoferrales bacterium]